MPLLRLANQASHCCPGICTALMRGRMASVREGSGFGTLKIGESNDSFSVPCTLATLLFTNQHQAVDKASFPKTLLHFRIIHKKMWCCGGPRRSILSKPSSSVLRFFTSASSTTPQFHFSTLLKICGGSVFVYSKTTLEQYSVGLTVYDAVGSS